MQSLESVLDSLDPPIKHDLRIMDEHASLLLIDTFTGIMVQRSLTLGQCENRELFGIVLLYAINELRIKGAHLPLSDLPTWKGHRP